MKKILAIVLAAVMLFAFAACGGTKTPTDANAETDANEVVATPLEAAETLEDVEADCSGVKLGLICLHDENSTYDKNFIDAAKAAAEELKFELVIKTNVPESDACTTAAEELVAEGCNVIFANSFGHETFVMTVAEENPEVEFCHATGTNAKTAGIANFHNAFAAIYEGRYLAGIAAGMKLNEMIEKGDIKAEEAKIGYVGAYPYAEVKSGYTSFFLGARSVCETATMAVKYTNSWFDIAAEKEAALALIGEGCVLVSQHADSEGAPKACEEKKVPNVAYNVDTTNLGPTTALISSKIDWTPYFKLIAKSIATDKAIPADWCGTIATGSVALTALNEDVAAEGTQEAIDAAIEKFKSGELKVYSTENFTVGGEKLESYKADVISDKDFTPDTEVIVDGVFAESYFRSAPYFDVIIDGITAAQ